MVNRVVTTTEQAPACELSVILPVRNGEPFFRVQLEALAGQVCAFDWELIVVDNGSTDGSAQTAESLSSRFPRFRLLHEPIPGKSRALNRGIEAAGGKKLVFLDADDEVAPGYLAAMARGLDSYEMVSSRVETCRLNPPWAHEDLLPMNRLAVFLNYRIYIPGALIGIRASTREKVGDFAVDLSSAEDVDFTWRAQLLGVSAGLIEEAVLHYRRPPDALGNFRKARSYGRSHVWLYIRFRRFGQKRLPARQVLRETRAIVATLLHHEDHWQWSIAWQLGLLFGRLEESVRRGVWYP